MSTNAYQDFLDFWFSERVENLWFNSTPEFDQELKNKFEQMYQEARADKYQNWIENVYSALALVILFDQIPLNIYRNLAGSYATEAKARVIARDVIEKKWDKTLNKNQKMFLYMPFMHSENLQDQDTSVALFENEGMDGNVRFAKHHREIVARFGRFPHRNEALNRPSTEQELQYLASDEAFKG